jgi:multidrug efflux pump subunit AcrA (membrane-fusion protein)
MYLLAIVAVAVAVVAILEIGPPTSSARTSTEVVTAATGVVQSTVTGTGNVEAGTDVDVNFKTSGTLQNVYVSQGQHVNKGQLLATLDPTSAQLAVDQAEEQLNAAQDSLTAVEDGTSSGSGSGGGSGSGSGSGGSATTASLNDVSSGTEFVTFTSPSGKEHHPASGKKAKNPSSGSGSEEKGGSPSTSSGSTHSGSSGSTHSGSSGSTHSGSSGSTHSQSSGSTRGGGSTTTTTQTTTTPSPASIASAQASVFSAQASLNNAQAALNDTKLFAPTSGTIASTAGLLPGDSVSAGSSSSASNSSSSSSSSSGSGGFAGGTATAGSLGGSSSSSSSGSSSPFAEIVNTGTLTMTVAFSESDISKIKNGQAATVTFDALPGVELGAHVTQISTVGTSSSGVVSYNATITLDQHDSQVRPGMSASSQVIISQAQGVTVPNAAVTGTGSLGTVNVMNNGKTSTQQVVVGLRGDSRTQIISGLRAGQQLVITITLPAISSATSSPTGSSGTGGTLGGGRFGGAGAGAGAFGGGGAAFFRRAGGGG